MLFNMQRNIRLNENVAGITVTFSLIIVTIIEKTSLETLDLLFRIYRQYTILIFPSLYFRGYLVKSSFSFLQMKQYINR